MNTEQIRQLFLLIDWMMELPGPVEIEFWKEVENYKKDKEMTFISTPERFGLQRGLSQGIEGMLRLKFGEPGLRLMPEIREIKESEKLEAILNSIETAASPEDLRRIWAD